MSDSLLNIWWIIGIVMAVNLLFLLTKSDKKYWRLPILFWGLLLASIFVFLLIRNMHINNLDNQYLESAVGKKHGNLDIWKEIKEYRRISIKLGMSLFHFLGLQSLAIFIWQIIGQRKTKKETPYRRIAITFGLLTMLYLILQFLVTIIPSGPFF
jgi:hypothetical protein